MLSSFFRRIGSGLARRPWAATALVLAASVALSLWAQSSGHFPDPDSFYHGRVAKLMAERGVVQEFPWLAGTVLADSYVDHHFLYHVFLIPFVALAPTIADGLLASAVVFCALAVAGGALLLRGLGVGGVAYLAPVLFLLSNPLLFRLNLAKAPAVSLIALFLGFYAAAKKKPFLLAAVAFGYVWLYDGWILLLVLVATLIAADVLVPDPVGGHTDEDGWHWKNRLFGKRTRMLAIATGVGILLGHVLNPYFPKNLAFEWLHIVRIGIVGFKDRIGVGAEWYPYEPLELVAVTWSTWVAFALGTVAFFVSLMHARQTGHVLPRQRVRETVAFVLFAAIAAVFAVRSKRNVEYFVPFAVLASVSAFDLAHRTGALASLRAAARSLFGSRGIGIVAIAFYFMLLSPLLIARDWKAVRKDFTNGVSREKYAAAADWLTRETPEGALVFHGDWDDFPYFFLHQTHNRFLVGLDPAFMYVKSPERFQEWVDITQGRVSDRLVERIRDGFGAEYVFMDTDHGAMRTVIERDGRFRKVYADDEGAIYAVPDAE